MEAGSSLVVLAGLDVPTFPWLQTWIAFSQPWRISGCVSSHAWGCCPIAPRHCNIFFTKFLLRPLPELYLSGHVGVGTYGVAGLPLACISHACQHVSRGGRPGCTWAPSGAMRLSNRAQCRQNSGTYIPAKVVFQRRTTPPPGAGNTTAPSKCSC